MTDPEPITPAAHAAALRPAIVDAVTAAIEHAVHVHQREHGSPWYIEVRPRAPTVRQHVNAMIDDVLCATIVRAVEGGKRTSIPSLTGLRVLGVYHE